MIRDIQLGRKTRPNISAVAQSPFTLSLQVLGVSFLSERFFSAVSLTLAR